MFDFDRIGVYQNINRPHDGEFLKINSVGCESINFIESDLIDDSFKKINVLVLVQKDNKVFVDDNLIPHVLLTERDLNNVFGRKTNDAILAEAATRAAFNAGTTIKNDSLNLVGKIENDTEVYFVYTGLSGRVVRDHVSTMTISSITSKELLGLCDLKDFY